MKPSRAPHTAEDSLTGHKGKRGRRRRSVVTSSGRTLCLPAVQRRNRFGESLLHRAVMQGDLQMLKAILQLGPDVNMADNAGWTPLHEAALYGHYEACRDLINAGAEVNAAAANGVTPLHDVIRNGHERIAELLLKHDADPLLQDRDGQTALSINTDPFLRRLMVTYIPEEHAAAAESGNREEEISAASGTQCEDIRGPQTGSEEKDASVQHHPHICTDQTGRSDAANSCRGRVVSESTSLRNPAGNTPAGRSPLQEADLCGDLRGSAAPQIVEDNTGQDVPALMHHHNKPGHQEDTQIHTQATETWGACPTSCPSQAVVSADVLLENQRQPNTSADVTVSCPAAVPPPSALPPISPCGRPPRRTPPASGVSLQRVDGEDSDSDRTLDFAGDGSDESVDWDLKATQNFNLRPAGVDVEDAQVYTFPTERV
ncbi:tonsoku-like protein [Brachyistius frenatus]|uniref:tonsoku-like protein n=1 Tax=Brachyistius frenatus TaxID=100188 RepID=UPI0037E83881